MLDLVFFSSPIGLGHATRDVAISQNLDNISKRFVSGSTASSLILQNGFDEDDASLVIAQEMGIKTILVTDILKTNFARGIGSIIERKMNKSMRGIIEKCDLVILPENGKDEDNLVRVGPIVRETPQSREQLRKKFSFDKKTIVVSIGGTDLGRFLIEKILEIRSKINPDFELVIR